MTKKKNTRKETGTVKLNIPVPATQPNESISLFTKREKEVVLLLRKGKSEKMIADNLGITKHTVAARIKTAKGKGKAFNIAELVAYSFLNESEFIITNDAKSNDTE